MALAVQSGHTAALNQGEGDPPSSLRRSVRNRKPRVLEPEEEPSFAMAKAQAEIPKTPSPVQSEELEPVRRNPKRKATPEFFDVPGYLLEASLEAWNENELEEWPSWAEVESDPELFNRILRLLGVDQAKLQEVYSVEPGSLATLPDPVYGLIFLYEYCAEAEDTNPVEPSDDLWFANQTTSNACATVAMLNIIMNAEGLALGDKLAKFKQDSKDLSPPLRGHLLSTSSWIRVAANSFARRLDLLTSALCLSNQVEASMKKQRPSKKRKITITSAATRKKRERPKNAESAYHFIAYVPLQDKVWQLDGLQTDPRCVGEFQDGEHWTSVVSSVLAAKMLQSETDHLSFNLLALHGDVSSETGGEAGTITGRKKDHSPAIHEWVKKLAERGVLGTLAEKVRRGS